MTPTLERELATYLDDEAARVRVRDGLDDIEHGVTLVALRTAPAPRRSRILFAAAAAAVAAVIVLAAVRHDPPTATVPGVTPSTVLVDPTTTAASATTAAPATTVLQTLPLPAGGTVNGMVPECTTTDGIAFDCTTGPFPEDLTGIDYTGYTQAVVDDTSHVSGGCRSVSPDATHFTCYLGQRAVDEGVVAANYLGDWAPIGYSAG